MLIVYDSLTGNVQRFVNKLDKHKKIKITDDLIVNEPFILITYTTGFGEVPKSVMIFLQKNSQFLKGVAASGNKVWGDYYTKSAITISKEFNVPILLRFELSGTQTDVNKFLQEVENIERSLTKLD
ncbi:class Ib ribonucleoside-diphosphate reductase assembly flavoprotein NrdI [Bacillus smithii]|uniref:class Ib ribonucleoside-diphosphate reductase assembly flavoprotein NrdI n=1 Tax=Bacillus smithii TaxID=1479 RepID=UPI002E220579|nr:class Ib ribonucleoside-diphosphate reductase assembly flavoprotein NrdI [Bacillus smithii]MED4928277.1 class Ib ribonucleoside-diphosphate reductase assembly flavoprotein NrdI [Bacillus smithii]